MNVNKAIIEVAEMKFVNYGRKRRKIRCACFFKESNIEEGREVRNKINQKYTPDIESLLFCISYILKEITISHQF